MTEAYRNGFMSKCAELGIPGPVAERMCKTAYELGSVNGEDSVSDLMYYAPEDPEAKRYFHVDPASWKRIPVKPPSRAGVTTMPISAEEQLDRYLMLSHDNPDYNRRIPIVRNGVPASTRWSGLEDLANLQSDAIRRRRGVRQPPGRRPTWLQRRIMESVVGRGDGGQAVKSAQSFGDGTFVLSKGQTPSHAARAWNASHPGSAVTPEQILAANPGVPATGFVAGTRYAMPKAAPKPAVEMRRTTAGSPPADDARAAAVRGVRDFIRSAESFRPAAYMDKNSGLWTLGYGQTYMGRRRVREGDTITRADAEAFVNDRLGQDYDWLLENIPRFSELSPWAQYLLMDLRYNTKGGTLGPSVSKNLHAHLSDRAGYPDPDAVVLQEYPTYVKANGTVVPGLYNRRVSGIRTFVPRDLWPDGI